MPSEAAGISALIHSLLHHRSPDPAEPAPEHLLAQLTPQAIAGYIASDDSIYLVALAGETLAGVLHVKENRHLSSLFVAEPWQGRGISRALWERAKADLLESRVRSEISVNSSVYAVPVYERFGFEACGPRVDAIGLSHVPMRVFLRRGHGPDRRWGPGPL